ncbi:MAG: hypothetical protein JXR70_04965 [Spirochaetales bacterium]|nr:hypothetical protein [Spirochaetales bacterium]
MSLKRVLSSRKAKPRPAKAVVEQRASKKMVPVAARSNPAGMLPKPVVPGILLLKKKAIWNLRSLLNVQYEKRKRLRPRERAGNRVFWSRLSRRRARLEKKLKLNWSNWIKLIRKPSTR